ncbi:hypothetical protein SLEP1_g51761 [Rubroshorea leprosula]|uniref:DEK-C domain-containing protein n=1 Tax=Rubroshorea leprosula TaxID=152421 RepID=A0AAV5M558_9ROSI|nr:hypothetical protein SLEP1_g51761 [Rubroshorea leprosula]
MGEEETKTEVPEAVANGTAASEKPSDTVDDKTVEENDGLKEMEEDKKDEADKMDEDPPLKEDEASKLKKEEPNGEAMDEETGPIENDETEKEENKEVEEEEGSEEEEKQVDEEEGKTEEIKQTKGSRRRGKGKNIREKVKGKTKDGAAKKDVEQRTPVTDRPVRERKTVERLVASIEKDSSRELQIEKGRGTPLKDIPNVAFKLSRRKSDDTFRLLHTILFGRRGKAIQIKGNISRFSGFVWHENEEKQKMKVKEKFDKCNKEKLLELCDVLDITVAKATTRKEDIVTKLIDFLVAPHATTTVLLAEKEKPSKGIKRKRSSKQSSSTSGNAPSKRSAKSQGKNEETLEAKGGIDTEDESEDEDKEEEENEDKEKENGVPEKSEDEMPENSESEEKNESEEDVGKKKRSKASSRKKDSAKKAKTKKAKVAKTSSPPPKVTPKRSSSKRAKVEDHDDEKTAKASSRKRNMKVTKEKSSTPAKSASKEKPGKKVAKRKDKGKEEKLKPTDEELRDAICEILKEVDFNTATFTDILKLLAQQFNTDLTPRKSSIKLMIQEELTKLADEADDEDGEGDAGKDETTQTTQSVGQEVVA